MLHPFFFTQNMMTTQKLTCIALPDELCWLIRENYLTSLPIPLCYSLQKGDLICFEPEIVDGSEISELYTYAIALEVSEFDPHKRIYKRYEMNLVRFRPVQSVSRVVIE